MDENLKPINLFNSHNYQYSIKTKIQITVQTTAIYNGAPSITGVSNSNGLAGRMWPAGRVFETPGL